MKTRTKAPRGGFRDWRMDERGRGKKGKLLTAHSSVH